MTAEIGILNKNGVALAADSAVTCGTGKIYNTANKLFSLSIDPPIAIMIYSNAEFLGVPWEVIIKVLSKEIKKTPLATVKEYKERFITLLQSNEILFPQETQIEELRFYFSFFLKKIIDMYLDAIKVKHKDNPIKEEEAFQQLKEILEEIKNSLKKVESLCEDKQLHEKIRELYPKELKKTFRTIFEKHPVTDKLEKSILDLFLDFYPKHNMFLSYNTGIVLAGYGEKEIFPSLESIKLYTLFDKTLFHANGKSSSQECSATIFPFAQSEMVQAFMDGIDSEFISNIEIFITTLFNDLTDEINKTQVNTKLNKAKEIIEKQFTKFINDARQTKNSPVMDAVRSLSKEGLAEMAENLVALTSFKRKVSTDRETVGGPIDVVVISKGDGLCWIKRKHYFKPELNLHQIMKYLKY